MNDTHDQTSSSSPVQSATQSAKQWTIDRKVGLSVIAALIFAVLGWVRSCAVVESKLDRLEEDLDRIQAMKKGRRVIGGIRDLPEEEVRLAPLRRCSLLGSRLLYTRRSSKTSQAM